MKENIVHDTSARFISPKRTLEHLGLSEGESVIDFGCGAGHWAIAAASIVGKSGFVVALEEDPEMLALVIGQSRVRGLTNISTSVIGLEKAKVDTVKPADLVIVCNVLNSLKEKDNVASSLAKLVSEKGKLLFIDWLPGKTLLGPADELRLTEESVISTFESSGLKFACMVDAGNHHFGLIFDNVGDGCGWKK